MQLRLRASRALLIAGVTVVAAGVWWNGYRTAGAAEVRAVTARVADAVERGDEAGLAVVPHFAGHPDTVGWLLRHRPALEGGYQIEVSRNGDGGYQLLSPDLVTHVGLVRAAAGELRLGFRYDLASGRVEFVTASFSTLSAAH